MQRDRTWVNDREHSARARAGSDDDRAVRAVPRDRPGRCRAAGSRQRARQRSWSAADSRPSLKVPVCTTRPSSRITSRSASAAASSGSWVTSNRTPGNDASRLRRSRRTAPRALWSRAASGSSSRSRRGSVAIARASATRWACPPESSRGFRLPSSPAPTRTSAFAAARRASRPLRATAAEPERHVLEHGEVREQQVVLKHHADRPPLGLHEHPIAVVEHVAVELDPPSLDRHQTGERAQQGRLARAVGTEDRDGLTLAGVKLRVEVQRTQLERDLRGHGHPTPSQRSRRNASTATHTASSTMLRPIATCGFDSRRR